MKILVQKDAAPIRVSDELFYLILLGVMAAAVATIVTSFALMLHRNFLTIACDTAAYQNALVNTLHGHFFRETAYNGPSLLVTHAMFVLLALIPLYVIAPSVEMLFSVQVWAVYSSVIPLYLIALQLLRRPGLAFCVAAAALISPFLVHLAVAPFHPETWILASTFWSYYFYRRNNVVGFCASLSVAVCSGEQAALIYLVLGVALLVVNDGVAWRRLFGLVSLGGGIAWIILDLLIVGPVAHDTNHYNNVAFHYEQWKINSISELPGAVARQPREALGFLFNLVRWQHVTAIIGLPLFAALLSWRSLILLAPVPFYFLMVDREFLLYFHAYYFSFVFFAAYLGLLFFMSRSDLSERFGISLVALTALTNAILLCMASFFYINMGECQDDRFTSVLRKAFSEIPISAGVYSPHRYSAYLSNRENMVMGDLADQHFDFDLMLDARFFTTDVHPQQIDYIVVDCISDQCGCRMGGYDANVSDQRSNNINSLTQSGEWKMVFNRGNVVILQRVKQ